LTGALVENMNMIVRNQTLRIKYMSIYNLPLTSWKLDKGSANGIPVLAKEKLC